MYLEANIYFVALITIIESYFYKNNDCDKLILWCNIPNYNTFHKNKFNPNEKENTTRKGYVPFLENTIFFMFILSHIFLIFIHIIFYQLITFSTTLLKILWSKSSLINISFTRPQRKRHKNVINLFSIL